MENHRPSAQEKNKPVAFLSDPSKKGARLSIWFYDGNIVLQAEHVIFRVYQGVLSSCSPIFKDMLAVPPPEDQEKFAECPLVRLPDRALDVYYFLKALLEHEAFINSPMSESFEANAALLRMGRKYEVPSFYHIGLTWFSEEYATTLDAYNWNPLPPLIDLEQPVRTISFLREFGLSFLLPVALYHISAFADSQDIFASKLSDDDKLVCLGLREALLKRHGKLMRALTSTHARPPCCAEQKLTILPVLLAFRGSVDLLKEGPKLQHHDESLSWKTPLARELCKDCAESITEIYEDKRSNLWDDLPELCGLPEWSILLDEQEVAREFFEPLSSLKSSSSSQH